MKNTLTNNFPFILILISFTFLNGCQKEGPSNDTNTDLTVVDMDGNTYHTKVIGTQTWMVENLKTTTYRNGDPIPYLTDPTDWENSTSGAYCECDDDPSNTSDYGYLYNWYVISDARGIAPEGWHIPSEAEWATMVDFLGGEAIAGDKLKESGTDHWIVNTDASNESGFTGLPGGYRSSIGTYYDFGEFGLWWTSTNSSVTSSYYYSLSAYNSAVNYDSHPNIDGSSIRCVKD